MERQTHSDQIRDRFHKALICSACKREKRSLRELAEEIGVSHTTLWRFRDGGGLSFEALDKVVAWLDRQEKRP